MSGQSRLRWKSDGNIKIKWIRKDWFKRRKKRMKNERRARRENRPKYR